MSGLAWRLLGRELRSGELRLLLAALVVAVAAVTAVGFFTDRVRLALEQEAQQLIGGDLLLISDHPWPAAIRDEAVRRGLKTAETVAFPSMVLADGQAQLADIKAVSSSLSPARQPASGEARRRGRARRRRAARRPARSGSTSGWPTALDAGPGAGRATRPERPCRSRPS